MIRELFERKASYEANVLAEAQALIDDGLDLDFVLGLFPDDAAWLEPLLQTAADVESAFEGEPASYYFEASLKSRFLGQASEPKPVIPVVVSAPSFSPMRTAVATASVAMSAAAIGILALGFVTAGDAAPGDWNYTFKLANERFEYSTSRGDSRIDIQIKQLEARVAELDKLSDRGEVSSTQFDRVMAEIADLNEQLARTESIDDVRKARIEGSFLASTAVLNDVATKQPELKTQAAAVSEALAGTLAAASGGATGLPSPTPSPTASTTATAPSTATTETATPTPETASPTPETATPTPEATATLEPSETTTEQPAESETDTPEASTTP